MIIQTLRNMLATSPSLSSSLHQKEIGINDPYNQACSIVSFILLLVKDPKVCRRRSRWLCKIELTVRLRFSRKRASEGSIVPAFTRIDLCSSTSSRVAGSYSSSSTFPAPACWCGVKTEIATRTHGQGKSFSPKPRRRISRENSRKSKCLPPTVPLSVCKTPSSSHALSSRPASTRPRWLWSSRSKTVRSFAPFRG